MSNDPYSLIVVGTDGSALAERTVRRAASLAAAEDADLIVVCAFSSLPRRADAMNVTTLGDSPAIDVIPGQDAAERAVREAVAFATDEGARVVGAKLMDGDAAAALIQVAHSEGADLLVIGAIRDRSIAERLLGTVASEVVKRAQCDVLIVRPLAEPAPGEVDQRPESLA